MILHSQTQLRQKSLNQIVPLTVLNFDGGIQKNANNSKSSFFYNHVTCGLPMEIPQTNIYGRQSTGGAVRQHHLKIPSVQGQAVSRGRLNFSSGNNIQSCVSIVDNNETLLQQMQSNANKPKQTAQQNQDLLLVEQNNDVASENREIATIHAPLSDIDQQDSLKLDECQKETFVKDYANAPITKHQLQRQLKVISGECDPYQLANHSKTINDNFTTPVSDTSMNQARGNLNDNSETNNLFGESSIGYKESLDINKSSETLHSDKNLKDDYHSNLRPRGINILSSDNTNQRRHGRKDGYPLISAKGDSQQNRLNKNDLNQSERYRDNNDNHSNDLQSDEVDDFGFDRNQIVKKHYYNDNEELLSDQKDLLSESSRRQLLNNPANTLVMKANECKAEQNQQTPMTKLNIIKEQGTSGGHGTSNVSGLEWGDTVYDLEQKETVKIPLQFSLSPNQKNRSSQVQPTSEDIADYSTSSPIRKAGEQTNKNMVSGGMSERSKKIVYQKGASGGVSQHQSRLDFQLGASGNYKNGLAGGLDASQNLHKPHQSFEFDEVRDIGTNPIEDESFQLPDISQDEILIDCNMENIAPSRNGDDSVNLGLDASQRDESQKEITTAIKIENFDSYYGQNLLLLTKPATGFSQYRSLINRKNPPKKLFDYLPKARRVIFKDPQVAGGFKVLNINCQQNQERALNDSQTKMPIEATQYEQQRLQMHGISINALPPSMIDCIDYYFKNRHIPQSMYQAQESMHLENEVANLNDDKFIKLSLMEKMNPSQGALDGDYFFTNLDQIFDTKVEQSSTIQKTEGTLRFGEDNNKSHIKVNSSYVRSGKSNDEHIDEISQRQIEISESMLDPDYGGREDSDKQKELSNQSGITSYEFESKILRNNYQQYLGQQIGSPDACLNIDLEEIHSQKSTNGKGTKVDGQTKGNESYQTNIPKKQQNIINSRQRQANVPLILNQASTANEKQTKHLNFDPDSKNKGERRQFRVQNSHYRFHRQIPQQHDVDANISSFENTQNSIIAQNNALDPASRAMSRGTLYQHNALERKTQSQLQNYQTTTRRDKDESRKHSIDLSNISRAELMHSQFNENHPQRVLRPIADIFINNRAGNATDFHSPNKDIHKQQRDAFTEGKKFHLTRSQRPLKYDQVKKNRGQNLIQNRIHVQSDYLGNKNVRQSQTLRGQSAENNQDKRSGGLFSEISKQFSDAVNSKKHTTQTNFNVDTANQGSLYRLKQLNTPNTLNNTKLSQDLNTGKGLMKKSPKSITFNSSLAKPLQQKMAMRHFGQSMNQQYSVLGNLPSGSCLGLPPDEPSRASTSISMPSTQRPKTTTLQYSSPAQKAAYQKYLRATENGKLQLIGRLNRYAAEKRSDMRSLTQQAYYCYPQTFMASAAQMSRHSPEQSMLIVPKLQINNESMDSAQ